MARRISLREVPLAIQNRREFTAGAGTMFGDYDTDGEHAGKYVIRSYRAVIATVTFTDRGDLVWVTDRKYSVTTSKHTNYARRGLAVELANALAEQANADPLALV